MGKKVAIVRVSPTGAASRLACAFMRPLMWLCSGTVWEEPKSGIGPLNYRRLSDEEAAHLDVGFMVSHEGIPGESDSGLRSHIPILGGRRNYSVLEPRETVESWFVGFRDDETGHTEVCREKNSGPVRMLVGSRRVRFFGINAVTGEQVWLYEMGRGKIGADGKYAKIRLR